MVTSDITVLAFGGRTPPRSLASLNTLQVEGTGSDGEAVEGAASGARRLVVLGDDADLAAVLTRLMRADLLDVEVAKVGGPGGGLGGVLVGARRAVRAAARRVPLIRDDTGTALAGSALWLPPGQARVLHGEAVVDDTVLFDGDVSAVRIEPTVTLPGLRATVIDGRRRRWISGRAAQLGTTGARVVRDGVEGKREVKRSTFYRHTTGWLRVG